MDGKAEQPGGALRAATRVRAGRIAALALAAAAAVVALRYGACTQDDAFISFRYARNLLDGHGLVYNPGERVEGYTNLLWTLLLAAAMGLGADPVPASAALGVASLLAAVLGTARLARRAGSLALAAPLLLAADPQLALEAVEGLETAFYVALVTWAAASWLDGRRRTSTLLFALAALTRPEGALVFALWHAGASIARRDWRPSLRPALAMAGVLAALTAWRLLYYGDPLPNTFYAKTGGFALPRGLDYLWQHARAHPVLWGLALMRPLAGPPGPATVPAAVVAVGDLAYVAWVGGDFKPTGRFVQPVEPLLALLAAEAASGVAARLRARWLRGAAALAVLVLLAESAARSWRECAAWAEERHANLEARRTVGLFLRRAMPPDTLLAIHSAGVIPYYAGLPTIDMWGLTDRHVARAPVPGMGRGMAGHERGDPAYVFSRDPDLYLPEDHVFALRPWRLEPEPGFPPDFTERYAPRSIPLEGRWLNLWARRGFLRSVLDGGR